MPSENEKQMELADLTPGQFKYFLKKKYDALTDPMDKWDFITDIYTLGHDKGPLYKMKPELVDVIDNFINHYAINAPDEDGKITPEGVKASMHDLLLYMTKISKEYNQALEENRDDPYEVLNGPLRNKINAAEFIHTNMINAHMGEYYTDPAWQRYNMEHPDDPIVIADMLTAFDDDKTALYTADPGADVTESMDQREKDALTKYGFDSPKKREDYILDVGGVHAGRIYEELSSQLPPKEELDAVAPEAEPAAFDQKKYASLYDQLKDLNVTVPHDAEENYLKTLAALNVLGHEIFVDSQSMETLLGPVTKTIDGKEEAWNQIHKNGNFEKLLNEEVVVTVNGIPSSKPLIEVLREKNSSPEKRQELDANIAYIRSHSGAVPQFVGDQHILDQPVQQYGSLAEFINRFGDPTFENYGSDLQFSEIDYLSGRVLAMPNVRDRATEGGRILSDILKGQSDAEFSTIIVDTGFAAVIGLKRFADVIRREISDEDRRRLGVRQNDTLVKAYNKVRNSEEYKRILEAHTDDAVFRHGMHVMKKLADSIEQNEIGEKTSALINDDEIGMNERMMERTLAPMNAEQVKDLNDTLRLGGDMEKLTGAVEKNMARQNTVAKMLFMAHMGGVDLVRDIGNNMDEIEKHDGSMSDLIAHGRRLKYNLPAGTHQKEMFDSIVGKDYGRNDGIEHINNASSSLSTQRLTRGGTVQSVSVEKRSSYNLFNNYRMDIPVGGLGSRDHNGNVRTEKNVLGHTYFKMEKGGARDCGGMLFSMDTAPDKQYTQFLSEKGGYGDDLNGRVVNLYRIKDQSFTNLMNRFDDYYRGLQREALSDPEKAKELTDFNKMLSGQQMGKETFKRLLIDKLGVPGPLAGKLFDQLRRDENDEMQAEDWVDIPPREDPNAGKTAQQIKNEAADRKAVFDNVIEAMLYENELYETQDGPAAEEAQENDFDLSMEFDENDAAVKHGWVPQAQQQEEPEAGVTLQEFLNLKAQELRHTTKEKDQDRVVCTMISAVYRTGGSLSSRIDPGTLDPGKIAKIPSVAYQLKHSREQVLQSAAQGKVDAVFSETQNLNVLLKDAHSSDEPLQERLRNIYDQMNVANLESRSTEYQQMVKTIRQMSQKEKMTGEDKIKLINSVENYASLKRNVPKTNGGKISLELGFQALEAVMPESAVRDQAWNKFVSPHIERIAQLRTEMERKGLREPDRLFTADASPARAGGLGGPGTT